MTDFERAVSLLNHADAILIRSWEVLDGDPAAVIEHLLGLARRDAVIPAEAGVWRAADAITGNEPVGKPRSLVVFAASSARLPVPVSIVPGSQGCDAPSLRSEQSVTEIVLGSSQHLVIDARCWYRTQLAETSIRLYWSIPRGVDRS